MFVLGFELARASLAASKGLATKLTHCGRPSNIEAFPFIYFIPFIVLPFVPFASYSIQAGVGKNILRILQARQHFAARFYTTEPLEASACILPVA
jgi:hypothetical protein